MLLDENGLTTDIRWKFNKRNETRKNNHSRNYGQKSKSNE